MTNRTKINSQSDIKLGVLQDHFKDKFSRLHGHNTETVLNSQFRVENKYNDVKNLCFQHIIPRTRILKCIEQLKLDCAPGTDGIMLEHIKHAAQSGVISKLSSLLTLCIRYGVVPDNFKKGLLIPILKKTNIDPAVPKNYRPVIISNTFSKILELYVLQEAGTQSFSDLQFGFVKGRGTNMAVSLSNDVIQYYSKKGSTVFSLSGQRPISYCHGLASCVGGVTQSINAQKPRDKFSLNFVTSSATPLRRCVSSLVCVNLLVWTLQDFKVPVL